MDAKLVSPLDWPQNWPRTQRREQNNRFKVSLDKAQDRLVMQLERMHGQNVIISANLQVRSRGSGFLASGVGKAVDPGVAVYFRRKDKDYVFAADKFEHIQDNMNAIALTIDALRGIERWGASDMMERAFSGFKALPAPGQNTQAWRETLGIDANAIITLPEITQMYRIKLKQVHPDYGGARDAFERLQAAYKAAQMEYAGQPVSQ